MDTNALIALDLERINRLGLGKASILTQEEGQVKYRLALSSLDPSSVVKATGFIQTLFGPRLLSSGSHQDETGNYVDARVNLEPVGMSVNQIEHAEITKLPEVRTVKTSSLAKPAKTIHYKGLANE